ncbi:hypothetical protein [Brucella anthropi]|uniref:hypothetical protein n=1 Tax=Brucella anthropi TaxID=529 RepID=UPI00030B33B6|nr:hypothetical protein [Brucella anthropi]
METEQVDLIDAPEPRDLRQAAPLFEERKLGFEVQAADFRPGIARKSIPFDWRK